MTQIKEMKMPLTQKFSFENIKQRPKSVTSEVLDEICRRITETYYPEKIMLFGSYASGQSSFNSDLDLLIIISTDSPLALLKRRERFGAILKLFPHKGFGIDMIILTTKEVENIIVQNEGEWDLILEILNVGKTLYERRPQN